MKKGLSEVVVVLDASGSMNKLKSDTLGGLNDFISKQKSLDGECNFSLVSFNSHVKTLIQAKNIKTVGEITSDTYVCDGWTALYDAVGSTIDAVGNRLASLSEDSRPEKVIVAVITDGEENKSTIYNYNKVSEMIKHQQSKYNWEIVFLASEMKTVEMAKSMGITLTNVANYDAGTAGGVRSMYASLNNTISNYRNGGTSSDNKFDTLTNSVSG